MPTQDEYEKDPGVALMLAWQAGDESAFDQIVDLYSGRVYSLLTRFLGHHPSREDFVQEVFLRVVRARDRYEPSARFTTWLYRIVFNLSVNETERAARRHHLSSRSSSPSGGSLPRAKSDPRRSSETAMNKENHWKS